MTIDFEILSGGICVTPCPFGKSAMVFSASCQACKHYAGRTPRQWPINCNYQQKMKKIMFNERFGLQQATFDGSKTLTHRIVPDKIMKDALAYQSHHIDDEKAYERYILDHAPYKVGEIVAVAQAYKYIYQFDCVPTWVPSTKDPIGFIKWDESKGYSNKMYVKAEYMPHHIKMTGIKVEGLAGISDEDCLKEGIYELKLCESEKCVYTFQGDRYGMWKTPYLAYKELIDRLNHRGFFESNPLTYAYEYKLID